MVMTHRLGWLVAISALLAGCASGTAGPPSERDQLAFGIAMAERGLWSEAHFRFEEAARVNPRDPRILNNLAVANEALGNFDAALESYRAALGLAPGNAELKANYDRFVSFYESFRARQEIERAPLPPEPVAALPSAEQPRGAPDDLAPEDDPVRGDDPAPADEPDPVDEPALAQGPAPAEEAAPTEEQAPESEQAPGEPIPGSEQGELDAEPPVADAATEESADEALDVDSEEDAEEPQNGEEEGNDDEA